MSLSKEERLQKIEDEARKLRQEIEAEKKAKEVDINVDGVYLTRSFGEHGLTLSFVGQRLSLDELSIPGLPSTKRRDAMLYRKGVAKLTDEEVTKIVRFARDLVAQRES